MLHTTIETIFLVTGICFLLLGVYYNIIIIKNNPKLSGKWWFVLILLVFFVAGYIVFAIFNFHLTHKGIVGFFTHLTTAIFFGGGIFVALLTGFSHKTIMRVRQFALLSTENRQIKAVQERLTNILDNAAESIITFDAKNVIENSNQATKKLFGYQKLEGTDITKLFILPNNKKNVNNNEEFLKNISTLINTEFEMMGRAKNGRTFPISVKINSWQLHGKQLYTCIISDISRRKELIEDLQDMAEHDGLTGLYNRKFIEHKITESLDVVNRGESVMLLYMDLDNFKSINDSYGHATGDRLLIDLSKLICKRLRKNDYAARIGGDEFVILLGNTDEKSARRLAEALRKLVSQYHFKHNNAEISVSGSFGITKVRKNSKDAAEALANADHACYMAKKNGRNQIQVFNLKQHSTLQPDEQDIGWIKNIKYALANNNITLKLSPIITAKNKDIFCYQLIAYVIDDHDKELPPNSYMPAAERFGLATEIDKWLIDQAISVLQQDANKKTSLYISLSMQTFNEQQITDVISNKIAAAGIDAKRLIWGLPENAVLLDITASEKLFTKLHIMGCKNAIEDFTLDTTSLNYLREIPVDIVKFDCLFCANLGTNKLNQAVTKSLTEILHVLKKEVILVQPKPNVKIPTSIKHKVDYIQTDAPLMDIKSYKYRCKK